MVVRLVFIYTRVRPRAVSRPGGYWHLTFQLVEDGPTAHRNTFFVCHYLELFCVFGRVDDGSSLTQGCRAGSMLRTTADSRALRPTESGSSMDARLIDQHGTSKASSRMDRVESFSCIRKRSSIQTYRKQLQAFPKQDVSQIDLLRSVLGTPDRSPTQTHAMESIPVIKAGSFTIAYVCFIRLIIRRQDREGCLLFSGLFMLVAFVA